MPFSGSAPHDASFLNLFRNKKFRIARRLKFCKYCVNLVHPAFESIVFELYWLVWLTDWVTDFVMNWSIYEITGCEILRSVAEAGADVEDSERFGRRHRAADWEADVGGGRLILVWSFFYLPMTDSPTMSGLSELNVFGTPCTFFRIAQVDQSLFF